jgi:tetratricopeptide (TPR) repeat protein
MYEDDIEDWEYEYELINSKDFEGLIEYRKSLLVKKPNDEELMLSLSDAQIMSSDFNKALEGLTILYKKEPDEIIIQHTILMCLFELGRTEKDFSWVNTPKIALLNKDILDVCFEVLKGKKKPRSLAKIYVGLEGSIYLKFGELELFMALKEDGRFDVEGEKSSLWNATVKRRTRK